MAIALIAFGVGMLYINRARVSAEIDQELMERATRSRRPPNSPGPPPGFFSGQMGEGGPIEPPRGQGFPRQRPPGMDTEQFRIADLRRPRHFDMELNPISETGDVPFDRVAARNAQRMHHPIYSNGSYEGEPIRILSLPWNGPDGPFAIVQVARETRDLDRLLHAQSLTLAILLPIAIGLAAIGGFFLTERAMKPIAQMQRSAETISGANLSQRLSVSGDDEFAQLAQTFNSMIGRLEGSFRDLQQAYEHQRRFSADASHELRTPLTRLKLATSSALRPKATSEERLKSLQIADRSAESMIRLINQLLLLAKADAGQLAFQPKKSDLRVLASEALDSVEFSESVKVETEFPESAVYAEVDEDAVKRVVINLLENAARYTRGSILLQVAAMPGPSIAVSDNGTGVSKENLNRLGERFFRVEGARDAASGGTGLGLAICKTIVEAHGGTLTIDSEEDKGTRILAIFKEKFVADPNQTNSS
ncbi:MAG TPA: HAMP domain-containing sensor histidine kinase [Fimbriimonadaceae bacterium]|nr:HAMP domain-containing sensor histidine kinase [Fimbriimonadaceae bacterium]